MALASTPTLLSLDRYAKIMGMNPVQFHGGEIVLSPSGTKIFPVNANCDCVIPRYNWQANDRVSHEALADAIRSAEADIAKMLGYSPAPAWFRSEEYPYPKHHRINTTYDVGLGADGWYRGLKTRHGKLIKGGKRTDSALSAGETVVFSDPDSDGYNELATITVTGLTAEPEWGSVRVYHDGHGGDDAYWIRDLSSVSYSAGTLTIKLRSWLLLMPAQYEKFPTDAEKFTALEIHDTSDATMYAQTVDVYSVYNDDTVVSATFYWFDDSTTQDGVFSADEQAGFARPIPATYNSSTGLWEVDDWSISNELPNLVKLFYYAGERSDEFLAQSSYDPLSHWLAETIAWVATARLGRPFCSCGATKRKTDDLMIDLTLVEQEGKTYYDTDEVVSNPLGVHKGEFQAYKRLMGIAPRRARTALV